MKTKNLNSPLISYPSGTIAYYYTTKSGSSGSGSVAPYSASWNESVDEITYTNGRGQENYCYHKKVSTSIPRILCAPYRQYATLPPTGSTSWTEIREYPWKWRAYGTALGVPPLAVDTNAWKALSSRAVQAMWPEVENKVSSLNFAIELPQVRDLIPSILKLGEKLDLIINQLKSLSKNQHYNRAMFLRTLREGKRPLRQIISSFANANLVYQYGVLPLLSDITGFSQVARGARADARRLLDNEHKLLKSHFTCEIPDLPKSSVHVFNGGASPNQDRLTTTQVLHSARYHATMKYSYFLLDYQRRLAYDLALWDALGFNLNPRIIWDALPWSFVVDWFAKFGDFLDQWKWRELDPIVDIRSFVHSRKLRYSKRSHAEMCHNGPSSSSYTAETIETVLYERAADSPDLYSAIRLSGLNSYEFRMGGSLIGARL